MAESFKATLGRHSVHLFGSYRPQLIFKRFEAEISERTRFAGLAFTFDRSRSSST